MFHNGLVFEFLLSVKPYHFYYSPVFRKEVFPNFAGIIDAILIENAQSL